MLAAVGVRPIEFEKEMNVSQNFDFGEKFAKFKIGSTVVLGIPRETADTICFNKSLVRMELVDSETMIDIREGTILGWNAVVDKKLRNLSLDGELQISKKVWLRRDGNGFKFLRERD